MEEEDGRNLLSQSRQAEMASHLSRRLFLTAAASFAANPAFAEQAQWRAGNYSFSDELGGFTIRAISGLGSRDNPIVIEEELDSASPVTLTVRSAAIGGGQIVEGNLATGSLYLRILALNGSGHSWIEFEFELQEILNQSSLFSDGLSFDQRRETSDSIGSDRFAHYSRDFEPYDRLRFSDGKVDVGETAQFEFPLTDFTPRWQFYIVQDPRIPYS